jgi:hypothetical protein
VDDDYLWDASGRPDPDVERLERLLAPLRSIPPAPRLPQRRARLGRWRVALPLLTAAAGLILFVVWRPGSRPAIPPADGWSVTTLAGSPRVGAVLVAADGRLRIGDALVTDSRSRARISADVGEVEVGGDSRLRLVEAGRGGHRLALDYGTLRASIAAPPGRFTVETRSATAVDLGCVYTLRASAGGDGILSVQVGWVGFEFDGREVFVPAGASCRTSAAHGPGLPRFDDGDEKFLRAVDEFDEPPTPGARPAALRVILEKARLADAFTLWHLLPRVGTPEREAVFAALSALVAPPEGVTREAVIRLDRPALDRWWEGFGLGDVRVLREWKRTPPARLR